MSETGQKEAKQRKLTLQEEVETIWKVPRFLNDGPSAGIELPEGMRAVEVPQDGVVLRAIMPGLPEKIRDMPVGVFGDHCRPEEVQKEAERIFQGIIKGELRYREITP